MCLATEMNEKVAMEQPWIWNRLKYTAEAYTAAAAAVDMVPTTELAKLDSLLHKTWPLQQLVDEQEETDDLTNLQLQLSSSNRRSSSSRSSSKREKDNDDLFGSASERALAWQMILKPIPQKKKQFRALTHFVDFRYPNSNDAQQQQQQQQQQQHRQQQQPRILPLMGSHAALSKLHDESAILLRKILRQAGNLNYNLDAPIISPKLTLFHFCNWSSNSSKL